MNITITAENPGHGHVEVPDEEILKAYQSGGLEAVNELVQEHADAMPETPFWISEKLTEADIANLKERHG